MSYTRYTLAFIFDGSLDKVLLIEKNRPDWQKGYLNGIGGKNEGIESYVDCIRREVFEETNLDVEFSNMTDYRGQLISNGYAVSVYAKVLDEKYILDNLEQKTDEKIGLYTIDDSLNLLSSVKYVLPLCRESFFDNKLEEFKINYK